VTPPGACANFVEGRVEQAESPYSNRPQRSEADALAACSADDTCLGIWNQAPDGGITTQAPVTDWTTGVALSGNGGTVETDIGQAEFNRLFDSCPVVKYSRNGGVHSVYVRRAGRSEVDAFSLFTYRWASANNQLNTDFNIYDSEADARSETGAWTFCNYDDPDVGYPRDCGRNGKVNSQWFTFPSSGQHDANSGGGNQRFNILNINSGASLEIYTGADCPVTATAEPDSGNWILLWSGTRAWETGVPNDTVEKVLVKDC